MPGRTESLLRALGNAQRLAVLAEIAEAGLLSHAELRERLPDMSKATLSKTLTELEQLGLVRRPPSNRGQWRAADGARTRRLLSAAAGLAAALGRADVEADERLAQRFVRDAD